VTVVKDEAAACEALAAFADELDRFPVMGFDTGIQVMISSPPLTCEPRHLIEEAMFEAQRHNHTITERPEHRATERSQRSQRSQRSLSFSRSRLSSTQSSFTCAYTDLAPREFHAGCSITLILPCALMQHLNYKIPEPLARIFTNERVMKVPRISRTNAKVDVQPI
jgi:hypothetical protein